MELIQKGTFIDLKLLYSIEKGGKYVITISEEDLFVKVDFNKLVHNEHCLLVCCKYLFCYLLA